MLGLGSGLVYIGELSQDTPTSFSGLDLWLKVNTGVVGEDGGASADGDMADGEDITSWADQSGKGRHALGTPTDTAKPHWETDAADFGGLKWPDTDVGTHMDLTAEKDVKILANTDFTIMIRAKITNFGGANALIGSTPKDVIKWSTNKRVAIKIGDNVVTEFEEASATLATDTYYIHTLTRTDRSTGNLTYHIHGGSYSDKFWENDSSTRQDTDEFDITNIGCAADGVLSTEGVIKDVIIWNGTALTSAQRNKMYLYINGQEY